MDVGGARGLPDVDGARREIDGLDPAERLVITARGADPVAVVERRLLLREPIPMYGHPLPRSLRQLAHELEAGQSLALLEELLARQLAQSEVLPPRALLLTSEVAEHVREQRSRLLPGIAGARVIRHAGEQRVGHSLDAPVALAHRLGGLEIPRLRTGDGRRRLATTRLEPIAERDRRETVLAVVGRDAITKGVVDGTCIAHLERQLDGQAGQAGVAQIVLTAEAHDRLELLQAVPLDADPEPLAHDGVQVDEAAATEQPVERLGARRVVRDEALERRGLVNAEVIDAEIRVRLESREHEVEERLARRPLVRARERPAALVRPRPAPVAEGPAGQVLEAAVAEEGIALEVEEHIAARRLGQPSQPSIGLDGQRLERRQRTAPRLDLEPRLVAEPRVGLSRCPTRRLRERAVDGGEVDDSAV